MAWNESALLASDNCLKSNYTVRRWELWKKYCCCVTPSGLQEDFCYKRCVAVQLRTHLTEYYYKRSQNKFLIICKFKKCLIAYKRMPNGKTEQIWRDIAIGISSWIHKILTTFFLWKLQHLAPSSLLASGTPGGLFQTLYFWVACLQALWKLLLLWHQCLGRTELLKKGSQLQMEKKNNKQQPDCFCPTTGQEGRTSHTSLNDPACPSLSH